MYEEFVSFSQWIYVRVHTYITYAYSNVFDVEIEFIKGTTTHYIYIYIKCTTIHYIYTYVLSAQLFIYKHIYI